MCTTVLQTMRSIVAVCVLGYLCASAIGESFYENDFDSEDEASDWSALFNQPEEEGEAVRGIIENDSNDNVILTVFGESLDNDFGGGLASPPEESDDKLLPDQKACQEDEPVTPQPDSDLAERIETLLSQLSQTFNDKIAELENANKKLQEKVDQIEQLTKVNSVVFKDVAEGRRESHHTTLQKVLHVVNRKMKVNVAADDIAVALRADTAVNGTRTGTTATRPIVVRFVHFATKMRVLGASGRLARSKVSLSSDYSEGVAAVRAAFLPYLKAARARGQAAYILYDRLVVNGVRKTLQELQAERAYSKPHPMEPDQQVEELEMHEIEVEES